MFFQSTNGKKASTYQAGVKKTLLELYTASGFVSQSLDTIEAGARNHMAEGPFDETKKAILLCIRKAGKAGIARSTLQRGRGVITHGPKMFDDAVKWLLETEEVTALVHGGKAVKFFIEGAASQQADAA